MKHKAPGEPSEGRSRMRWGRPPRGLGTCLGRLDGSVRCPSPQQTQAHTRLGRVGRSASAPSSLLQGAGIGSEPCGSAASRSPCLRLGFLLWEVGVTPQPRSLLPQRCRRTEPGPGRAVISGSYSEAGGAATTLGRPGVTRPVWPLRRPGGWAGPRADWLFRSTAWNSPCGSAEGLWGL